MSENFSVFISSIFMIISVLAFGMISMNIKIKKELVVKIIICILIASAMHTIIYVYTSGVSKTLLLCLLYASFICYIFKAEFIKSIFMSIIYTILTIFPDLIVLTISTKLLGIGKELFDTNYAGSIIGNFFVNLIMILFVFVLRKPLRKLFKYNISNNKRITLVSLLTLASIGIFFYNLINTFKLNHNFIGYLIIMVTFIVILFYIFKQKIDNTNMLKKYDELLDIMKNYENDIEEQRTLIHETRNELTTIRCKIKDKEKESEIIEYIDSIMGDKVSSNMSKFSKFKYLPSNGLKGFFYYKFTEAERKGINVSVNISKQIENSLLGKLDTKNFKDLARVIGVYVDNAIEASCNSNDKKLGIEIYLIKGNIEIIISNTYANKVDENKIGKERYSTKGKNRGHGLLMVKRILNESSILTSETEITDKLYIQKIAIQNKKDQ